MPRRMERPGGSEATLARRMQYEREVRGWGYDLLAQRMTDAGCPMSGSSLYKIEKGTPRRGISVNEALAMCTVFDMGWEELLQPVDDDVTSRADTLFETWLVSIQTLGHSTAQCRLAEQTLYKFGLSHPDTQDHLNHGIRKWLARTPKGETGYERLRIYLKTSKVHQASQRSSTEDWSVWKSDSKHVTTDPHATA